MREPLSEIARRALEVVRRRALRDGQDIFEEMNKIGLIATQPRIQEIQRAALFELEVQLEMIGPASLLAMYRRGNSNPATAQDMYDVTRMWLSDKIRLYDN